jgi:hypothetical protein
MGGRLMPLNSGRTAVAAAGTALPLTAVSTACESVTITAFAANTKPVCVGGSDVVAAAAGRKGTPLEKGQTVKFTRDQDGISDLSHVFVDSEVNGEGVSYSYGHRQ